MTQFIEFRKSLVVLTSLFCLIVAQPTAVFGQTRTEEVGPFHPAAIENVSVEQLESLLQTTEIIQSFKPLFDYLNTAFADVRNVDKSFNALIPNSPAQVSQLQTDQIVYLLYNFPEMVPLLKEYWAHVNAENINKPETQTYRKEMKEKFKALLKASHVKNDVITLDSPTEPLLIKAKDNAPAFTQVTTYVNHPKLMNPNNPKSKLLPEDDLRSVVIQFIDGAKKSLIINVYEFDLVQIAEAVLKAKSRGVDVLVGIDKNTLGHGPNNQRVYDMLKSAADAHFKVVAVDPVGINHQKIVVRDAGTEQGQVLYSSGNFTQSCIGPEGDLSDVPKEKRIAFSRPNPNHAIVIDSPLMALVTKYELRKTLVKQLRGRQYPTSGSFVFTGPVEKETGKKKFAMLAFSPNGGMGDINRDILKRVILASKGPIWDMAFAFSSTEVIGAIKERAAQDKDNFDLKTIGDTSFAMRPWSGFLDLSGYSFDKDKLMYLEKEDPTGLKASLSPARFERVRSQIRVNPGMFGERVFKIDGASRRVTVKLHHKSMGFPEMGWAFMGKSFNDSQSAENNQEQILLIGEKAATTKLQGGFAWLYNQAPQSVSSYAKFRNKYHIVPDEPVTGEDGAADDKPRAASGQ